MSLDEEVGGDSKDLSDIGSKSSIGCPELLKNQRISIEFELRTDFDL